MGQIQSSIGLITGLPIQDTVDKLMQVNSQPRVRLASRNQTLTGEQTAITALTSLVIGVQLTTDRLGLASLFNATSVSSSKPDLLAATSSGSPSKGTYSFVPVRQAQSQQLTSSLLASSSQLVGAGSIKIQTGGFLDGSQNLDQLNGGTGVSRGFIRITDQAGTSRNIDLRFAQTAADVVKAINSTDGLSIVASTDGGRFKLTDLSGSSAHPVRVAEVDGGTTARDLGLDRISISGNTATGDSVTSLARSTALRNLRDGLGLELPRTGYSLRFQLADGSQVNYSTQLKSSQANLGQLIDEINATGNGKIEAGISNDGNSIEIKDLTSGANSLTISSPDGNLAQQLGLTGTAIAGVIRGGRLNAGLSDTLLTSLNGGQGLGDLGTVTITDRLGQSDTIDLSSASTLQEVINSLNSGASNASFRVQLNRTKTGIEVQDTSGGTGTLQIQNGDAKNTATALKIAQSTAFGTIDSGSLNRQFVGSNTSIAEFLKGDQTLSKSSFRITDSSGQSANFNVAARDPQTIGDIIEGINGLGIGVSARINQTGDGILLVDTAGGNGTLNVADIGTGTAAAQLRLAGTASSLSVNNSTVSGIDGTTTIQLPTTATTKVEDLVKQINELSSSPIRANLVNLGNSGVRLQINGQFTGGQSRVAISSNLGIEFTQTSEARDALVSFGANEAGGGVLASSSTNTFSDVVSGLRISVNGASTSPVTVTVGENLDSVTKQIQQFVDQYNTLRDKYTELTSFDASTNRVGTLFGSSVALRVDQAFSQFVVSSIRSGGSGAIRSLPELGIRLDDKGKLLFDKSQFEKVAKDNPAAVKDFFTNETNGFSKKAKAVADSLAGVDNGALLNRGNSLQANIEQNNARLAKMDAALAKQRARLLKQFYGMEEAIAKIQANMSSISQMQNLFTGSGTSSGKK